MSGTLLINDAITKTLKALEQEKASLPKSQFDLNKKKEEQELIAQKQKEINKNRTEQINSLAKDYGNDNPYLSSMLRTISQNDMMWDRMFTINEPKAKLYNLFLPIIHKINMIDESILGNEKFTKSIIDVVASSWKESPRITPEILEKILECIKEDYEIDLSAIGAESDPFCTKFNAAITQQEAMKKREPSR
jgi:hypothetical protein